MSDGISGGDDRGQGDARVSGGVLGTVEMWFARLSKGVNRLGGFAVLPAMTAVMMTEVVARYVFNSPFLWTFELASLLLLLVFLCGVVECTRTDGHIRMDLVYLRLPHSLRRLVRLVYSLGAIAVFALIVKHAGTEIPYLYSVPVESEYLRLPIWLFYAFLAAIAVMVILLFAMRVARIAMAIEDDENRRRH
jgi:TRAP-type C4-dicarboxylate transport system permease small subunit